MNAYTHGYFSSLYAAGLQKTAAGAQMMGEGGSDEKKPAPKKQEAMAGPGPSEKKGPAPKAKPAVSQKAAPQRQQALAGPGPAAGPAPKLAPQRQQALGPPEGMGGGEGYAGGSFTGPTSEGMYQGDMTNLKGMQIAEAMGGQQRPPLPRRQARAGGDRLNIWPMDRDENGIDLGEFQQPNVIDLFGGQSPLLAGR